ncbi:vWA domain-containing protein [Candidatus Methylocalor cossyra]|uniref:MxaL protein n=1 Tax=Candidatus Methylocalor cossyra TaxID=3108543 RepID=A0ABM9NDX1_9GAMM
MAGWPRPDPVAWALGVALGLALLALLPLTRQGGQSVYRYIAVVDITRSMNVEDYRHDGRAASRLEFVKGALRRLVAELPCGSRFGLGVFTERHSTLLFEPIETCQGFPLIAAALEQLDWRMAWAADSRIAAGLLDALEILGGYDAELIFLTDGHEAPPLNPRYRPSFTALRGRLRGVVVGVGGLAPRPIPKFDEQGRRLGVVLPDEVPHRSTFGLPELPPEAIEGYHARNAPFGTQEVPASEHLSALREEYLQQLAGEAGLAYHRLESAQGLVGAVLRPDWARAEPLRVDLRPWPAGLALGALTAAYLIGGFFFTLRR